MGAGRGKVGTGRRGRAISSAANTNDTSDLVELSEKVHLSVGGLQILTGSVSFQPLEQEK